MSWAARRPDGRGHLEPRLLHLPGGRSRPGCPHGQSFRVTRPVPTPIPFASCCGIAPIEFSSGDVTRRWLSRTGGRSSTTHRISSHSATPRRELTASASAQTATVAAKPCAASNDGLPLSSAAARQPAYPFNTRRDLTERSWLRARTAAGNQPPSFAQASPTPWPRAATSLPAWPRRKTSQPCRPSDPSWKLPGR